MNSPIPKWIYFYTPLFLMPCVVLLALIQRPIREVFTNNRNSLHVSCLLVLYNNCEVTSVELTIDELESATIYPSLRHSANYQIGLLFTSVGADEKAIRALRSSDSRLGAFVIGNIHAEHGDYVNAISAWKSAMASPYFAKLASRAIEKSDIHSAIKFAELAVMVSENPTVGDLALLSALYLKDNNPTRASETIYRIPTQEIELIPDLLLLRGNIRLALHQFSDADKDFSDALDLLLETLGKKPSIIGLMAIDIGNAYRAQGEYDRAENWYQKSLEFDVSLNSSIYIERGIVMQFQARHEDAINYFRKVIALDPGRDIAHYLLGISKAATCDYASAGEELDIAVDLKPDNGLYYYELAQIQEILGNHDLVDGLLAQAKTFGELDSWKQKSLVVPCE